MKVDQTTTENLKKLDPNGIGEKFVHLLLMELMYGFIEEMKSKEDNKIRMYLTEQDFENQPFELFKNNGIRTYYDRGLCHKKDDASNENGIEEETATNPCSNFITDVSSNIVKINEAENIHNNEHNYHIAA